MEVLRILFIGDIFGRPGRSIVKKLLPDVIADYKINFVIANGENAAGGKGITPRVAGELYETGIDVITSGNHVWANREVLKFIDSDERILRPANFPVDADIPGRGSGIYNIGEDFSIGVANLMGRVFMRPYDCPFRVGERVVNSLLKTTNLIIVDFHAEATSEKVAFGWHLDGNVTAVIGTHTHIPTADERVLPGGTAYITDAGMTGPFDSVIGVKKEIILHHFLTQLPVRHKIATADTKLCGVIITVDPNTGKAMDISRIMLGAQ